MISRLSQMWLPVVITSMPSSKRSSASAPVIPNPPAEFSPLAITRSMAWCFTNPGRRSLTIFRPGRPKMSPMKRMCMNVGIWFDGNTRKSVVGRGQSVVGHWSLVFGPRGEAQNLQSDDLQVQANDNDQRLSLPTSDQFRRLQKIVISGRIQSQVAHSLRMHQYV